MSILRGWESGTGDSILPRGRGAEGQTMEAVRAAQALFVLWIGAFAALVALNNIVDYGTNLRFVQHVFSMDTTFADSKLRRRAIRWPSVHHFAYCAIIAAEALAAGLCVWGAGVLFGALDLSADAFHEAKTAAFVGLALGFSIWFGGVVGLGARGVPAGAQQGG